MLNRKIQPATPLTLISAKYTADHSLKENNLADERRIFFFLPNPKFNVQDELRPFGHKAHKNNVSGRCTHRKPDEIKLPPYLTLQRAKPYHTTPRHVAYVKNLVCSQSRIFVPLENPMVHSCISKSTLTGCGSKPQNRVHTFRTFYSRIHLNIIRLSQASISADDLQTNSCKTFSRFPCMPHTQSLILP